MPNAFGKRLAVGIPSPEKRAQFRAAVRGVDLLLRAAVEDRKGTPRPIGG